MTSSRAPRRQLRPRPSAAEEPASPQQRTITRKSIADARAEWVSQQPRAEPNPPARVERTAAAAAPAPVVQNSPRAAMPNVLAPAPLSSMRWNDAPTTTISGNSNRSPGRSRQPAGKPAAAGRGSAAARGRSDCAHRCGRGAGKADRIVAEAASGDGRRPRAGRPHGKRDRPDRPHAGAPRHTPQAARDVGFRKDEAAFAATDVPRRGRRAAAHRGCVQSARTPGPDTRAPGAYTRASRAATRATRARTRAPQERTTRVPQERPRPPQERRHVPQDRVPQDRVPHDRERELQVTEMLARLARSAQT